MQVEREVFGEEAMVALGQSLAASFKKGAVVYLEGDLGMGKTTLVRGLLQGLGYVGPVKSPTYTLVEPYEVAGLEVFHFDLYRLGDPEELEYMGIRDYFATDSLSLIEWAELGVGVLPKADIVVRLGLIRQGRSVEIKANSAHGEALLVGLQE
ncbi:tRNA threonylcarbamoyladenosine biosynthesis protein TsaE [Marinomonas spartinae]|uniref:tRNA threonylcarbamoyladenosine biosynthesis protein TsaE n=1 Tax=Marinomonas spartinae TaxID=1792290 RepID=A0A1A8TCX3_9GAMM|nr:tRNA (adenosine(37)-N6)-threonylcarbamoyltransferase complex ATPase subunit type 1 TsaE [Marinomonas spartinae]SBS30149.1 tRNA threonylcarbamoyladenosine biosynthesis protein TsaE [Marinomonas spartinae]SBS36925.1 tRNA threonylcarbamoyladenosine biosynthesis protein TsaE [Marinomonas spartinae]